MAENEPRDPSPSIKPAQPLILRTIGLLAVFVFFVAVLRRAWMCDDAFITLRQVDNLVNGRGFVYNVGERVQGFTNPLWALLLSLPYKFSQEAFVTTVLTCLVVSVTYGSLLVFGASPDRRVGALVLLLLCFCKGFIDFSTSGLENPLSHLLLLGVAWSYCSEKPSLFRISLLASLASVNRIDSVVIATPIVLAALFTAPRGARLKPLLLGQLPAIAWYSFALIYYGFPFPNTAYAKLNATIPAREVWGQGVAYLLDTVYNDAVSAIVLLLGLLATLSAVRQVGRLRVILFAILCGVFYVISVGGDFMAGRFWTPVISLSAFLVARVGSQWVNVRGALPWSAAAAAVLVCVAPFSPFRDEPNRERNEIPPHGIANERAWYMFLDQLGLHMNLRSKAWQSGHYAAGKQAKDRGDAVVVAGNIGMFGMGAGPTVYVLDPLALTDPLLARIPFKYYPGWRPGHLGREIPAGYEDTLKKGENLITDPCVREFYEQLRTVVRGPLFTKARFKAMWDLNRPSGAKVIPCPPPPPPPEPPPPPPEPAKPKTRTPRKK